MPLCHFSGSMVCWRQISCLSIKMAQYMEFKTLNKFRIWRLFSFLPFERKCHRDDVQIFVSFIRRLFVCQPIRFCLTGSLVTGNRCKWYAYNILYILELSKILCTSVHSIFLIQNYITVGSTRYRFIECIQFGVLCFHSIP